MSIGNYASDEVTVIVGAHIVTGFAEGTFVSVEREADSFTAITGGDGETARSRMANRNATFTITLLQTSSSNDILSGLLLLDEQTNGGTFPILVKDASGRTVCSSEEGWITRAPTTSFGTEGETREWVLMGTKVNMIVAGNS